MCLRAACRYNPENQTLTLHNGLTLGKNNLNQGGLGLLVEPIFEFATGLSKLQLDSTEIALLAAVLLMQSGRCFNLLHAEVDNNRSNILKTVVFILGIFCYNL